MALEPQLAARIRAEGPLPFSAVMEAALYAAEGFFEMHPGAGRRGGDFVTSPEVGPLFGAVVARALDEWWDELGRPDPYVVVEAGAGRGMLARTVLAAQPRCAEALRYVLVERSVALRQTHGEHLPLAAPPATGDVSPAVDGEGSGPVVVSQAHLPDQPFSGVVIANELLDNLPVDLLARAGDGWDEILVALDGDQLDFVTVAAPPEIAEWADRLAPHATDDAWIPVARGATEWLQQVLALVERGRVTVFDYGDDTASMAERHRSEWLRTYRAHERGGHPLEKLGSQDITVDVAVDQLAEVAPPARQRSQIDWLAAHGIEELVEEGRRVWSERAAVADLDAVRARSRISEAAALTDPAGLGSFRVLEWRKP